MIRSSASGAAGVDDELAAQFRARGVEALALQAGDAVFKAEIIVQPDGDEATPRQGGHRWRELGTGGAGVEQDLTADRSAIGLEDPAPNRIVAGVASAMAVVGPGDDEAAEASVTTRG